MEKNKLASLLNLGLLLFIFNSFAAPEGGQVEHGDITISNEANAGNGIDTVIKQISQQGIISWENFNIGVKDRTHFDQPSAQAITLNRIKSSDPSKILGSLTATGHIILINRAGILFGPTARVDVAGLIATTGDISNQDFLAGKYNFTIPSTPNQLIVNQGEIRAKEHGLLALIAPGVENSGIMEARLGKVLLASFTEGSVYTLDLYGDELINFKVNPTLAQNFANAERGVRNSGTIVAPGGKVLLTADAARGVVDDVINVSGVIEANSLAERNGEVVLLGSGGGVVNVTGRLAARGEDVGRKGGKVIVTGEKVGLFKGAQVDVSGKAGGGTALIGGDYKGSSPIPEINASTSTATYVDKEATIKANALENGDGGKVIVWGDNAARMYGTIEAMGGDLGGNGGFVETSGHYLDVGDAIVNLNAPLGESGTWLLDPYNVTITNAVASGGSYTGTDPRIWVPTATSIVNNSTLVTNLGTTNVTITTGTSGTDTGDINVNSNVIWASNKTLNLSAANNITFNTGGLIQNTNTTSGNRLVLVADADASGSGTIVFGGSGYQINLTSPGYAYLYYNPPSGSYAGTDNYSSFITGTFYRFLWVNDVGTPSSTTGLQAMRLNLTAYYALHKDIDASATAGWNSGAGFAPIGNRTNYFRGRLYGNNYTISGLYINRPTSTNGDSVGLFGATNGSYISNVHLIDGNITGWRYVGGLVGLTTGSTTITGSGNTGYVTGKNVSTGGLVGQASNTSISNSYNTGTVTGVTTTGGLVGFLQSTNGNITTSYNAGYVNGSAGVGGLVGSTYGGNITDSYNIGIVQGVSSGIGGLVGSAQWPGVGQITRTYSSGLVIAPTSLTTRGGLIGNNTSYTVSNSFWDNQTSNQTAGGGGAGRNTTQMMTQATFTGFTFGTTPGSGTWYIVGGSTRPMLLMEYSTNITSANQLQLMRINLSANYTLKSNVNISTSSGNIWATNATSGSGFIPIGNATSNFVGNFAGNNHTISNLIINRSATNYIGLFGYANNANLSYVNLENSTVKGNNSTGSLAGYANNTTISYDGVANSSVAGNSTSGNMTGGLVGYASNEVFNYINLVNNTITGINYTAGLAGYASNVTVNNSSVTNGMVTANNISGNNTGGLVGYAAAASNITNVSVSGNVTGGSYVGGLVGGSTVNGNITNVTASANVAGNSTTGVYIGGIAGDLGQNLSNASVSGNVNISGNSSVGGLAGRSNGTINNSWSNVNVTAGGNYIGGLVGNSYNSINNSYSLGNVTGITGVGGLIGSVYSTVANAVNNSYSAANVTGSAYVGGFAGQINVGTVNNSYAIGTVEGINSTASYLAGFAGAVLQTANVTRSYSSGLVNFTRNATNNVGGFVGAKSVTSTVTYSYWDTNSSNQTVSAAGTGLNTTQMMQKLSFNNSPTSLWDFTPGTGSWFMIENNTRPMLQMENQANVTTPHQLQLMSLNLTKSYNLSNDIDLGTAMNNTADVWGTNRSASVGKGFYTIGDGDVVFAGNFSGNGHAITNLYMNRSSTDYSGNYQGLFGIVDSATTLINDISLTGLNISGDMYVAGLVGILSNGTIFNASSNGVVNGKYYTGGLVGSVEHGTINQSNSIGTVTGSKSYTGGLVGELQSSGSINNSSSTATVTGSDRWTGGLVGISSGTINRGGSTGDVTGKYGAGGLVGYMQSGTITNSSSSSHTVADTTSASDAGYVGGFVGYQAGGTINNTYSLGEVSGANYVAGFAGVVNGTISDSYTSGTVNVTGSATNVGGFAGCNTGSISADSFWDIDTSGQTASAGGTGKTDTQMKTNATFNSTWDFTNVWQINNTNSYPYFKWQTSGPSGLMQIPSMQQLVDTMVLMSVTQSDSLDSTSTNSTN